MRLNFSIHKRDSGLERARPVALSNHETRAKNRQRTAVLQDHAGIRGSPFKARHHWFLVPACLLAFFAGPTLAAAATALDEESPWPRVRSTNGNQVTLHLPQVEQWTSNWFRARAAVEVKPAAAKKELLGVIWFEAHGTVDRSDRVVTLDQWKVTRARFPEATDKGSNALAIVEQIMPTGARTVSLDYLITALGFEQAAARQGPRGLKHTPPEIIWATNRSVLVLIDGEPILRSVSTTTPSGANVTIERVVNTPVMLVRENSKFYLNGQDLWFAAPAIKGPWSLAQDAPPEIVALAPPPTNRPSASNETIPRIIISTTPAELLMTSGWPDFRTIRGTALQYAADTDSQLFFDNTDREAYLLLSGRWFKAKALKGPWRYVAPHDLPGDFARIPPNSPQAVVLASVPETPQAELALLANSVPTTTTIDRRETQIKLTYDGEPKFKPIEGTSLAYAINAQIPVVRTGDDYYGLDNGVWFRGRSPTGPWEVAGEVPEEIYTIPPSSPVFYATFARVYDASTNEVEVGYTSGYQGAYEDDGTVVYGTGYEYEPWYGEEYYGWGWTWGYNYAYVPWYQWWAWRPWWSQPGGLRAMVIQNIYNRRQNGNQVTPYRAPALTGASSANLAAAYASHPALYGRYWPTWPSWPTTASWPKWPTEAQGLPRNALMVNPYARPQTPLRAGEIPHGAQSISALARTPSSGRDLYASPDGNVYRRAEDGWYRRDAGNKWNFFAPTQGKIEGDRLVAARGADAGGARGGGARQAASRDGVGTRGEGLANRVPNSGVQPGAQEVANLERQYYARSLAQSRARSWSGGGGGARASGGRGGRR